MSFYYVKIYYGPCDSFHTVVHKPQKLRGLKDRLQKLGYRVDLIPIDYINNCVLEICGHEVFHCNINHMQFNTPYNLDPVCQRAIAAVLESSIRFNRARTYLWLWRLIESQIFTRTLYVPRDQWSLDIEPKNFSTCLDCIDCCKIRVKQNNDQVDIR